MSLDTYQDIVEYTKTYHRHKGVDGVLSCSMLPGLTKCGGRADAEKRLQQSSEESIEGSVQHKMQEFNLCPKDTPEEVKSRFYYVKDITKQLTINYTTLSNEMYMETSNLTGTPDKVMILNNSIEDFIIIDYKFGRVEHPQESEQMAGYAYLIYKKYKSAKNVQTSIIQPLSKYPPYLVSWNKSDVEKIVDLANEKYQKGKREVSNSCKFCNALCTRYCPESINIMENFIKGAAA